MKNLANWLLGSHANPDLLSATSRFAPRNKILLTGLASTPLRIASPICKNRSLEWTHVSPKSRFNWKPLCLASKNANLIPQQIVTPMVSKTTTRTPSAKWICPKLKVWLPSLLTNPPQPMQWKFQSRTISTWGNHYQSKVKGICLNMCYQITNSIDHALRHQHKPSDAKAFRTTRILTILQGFLRSQSHQAW